MNIENAPSLIGTKLNQKFDSYTVTRKKFADGETMTASGRGALGIYAFNSATYSNQGITGQKKVIRAPKAEKRRNERKLCNKRKLWKMKEKSASLLNTLHDYITKKDGSVTRPRVWHCGKTPVSREIDSISYVCGEKGNNYFTNLQHCASYWVCPVCAGKIAHERTSEIYLALKEYLKQGYKIYFGALTLPHYQGERLDENLNILIEGFNWVKEHRAVKSVLSDPLIYLRSLEITYGENGFHPHIHPIFILPSDQSERYLNQFRKQYFSWLGLNSKMTAFTEQRAVKFELWDKKIETLSDYLCKWSIGNEVGNGQSKKSKTAKGYTPFQILDLLADGKTWELKQDPEEVFKEYAHTIKGRRMLQSSRGFFETVKVEVKTDEEIVEDDKITEKLFTVPLSVWNDVVRKDMIFDLIEAYQVGGDDGVSDVIDYIYSLLENDSG